MNFVVSSVINTGLRYVAYEGVKYFLKKWLRKKTKSSSLGFLFTETVITMGEKVL